MRTLVKAPNLLSTLSKNAYVAPHYYGPAMEPIPTTWRNAQS